MKSLTLLALTVLVVMFSTIAHAKGPTVALVVTSEGNAVPFHFAEDSLKDFNVWLGGFLGDFIGEAAETAEGAAYRVRFYTRAGERKVKLSYIVNYYPSTSDSGTGRIHLAGRDQPEWRLNVQSIGRKTGWYDATPAWDRLLARAVPQVAD